MDTRSKGQDQQPQSTTAASAAVPKIPDEKSGASNFPSVPPQELHLFALKIRIKDNTWIQDHIPGNPRYLVSSTDYPTIIQAGFHYNALHMAARWGNVHVVQLVLSSISSTEFVKSLYPEDDYRSITKRIRFLTDMYLNTPETGALETPLHFASKFNCYEVIKLLIWHPSIDLLAKNDLGQTAEDIIGTRREDADLTEKVTALFRNNVIVPIWRDQFDEAQPFVGPPVNPKRLGEYTPAPFMESYGKISVDLFGPVDNSALPKSGFNNQWKIVGYAGPANELAAKELYNALRRKDLGANNSLNQTPPRAAAAGGSDGDQEFSSAFEPPRTPPRQKKRVSMNLIVTSTPTRGTGAGGTSSIQEIDDSFETLSIEPARGQTTPPRARQRLSLGTGSRTPPRIGQLTPTRLGQLTPPRHRQLQNYTANTSMNRSTVTTDDDEDNSFAIFLEETVIRRTDPEKGIERLARRYAQELDLPWVEYWAFLNKFVDVRSEQGLTELEAYFVLKEQTIEPMEKAKFLTPISQICVGLDKIAINSPGGRVTTVSKRQDRCRRRLQLSDKEDWRLHSFVQFKRDDEQDNDQERECVDVSSSAPPVKEIENNSEGLKTPIALQLQSDLKITRIFSDPSASADSAIARRKPIKPRKVNQHRSGPRPHHDHDKSKFMYRDKVELEMDSDADSHSEEEDINNENMHEKSRSSHGEAEEGADTEDERWYSPPASPSMPRRSDSSISHDDELADTFDECFSYTAFVKGQNPTKSDDQLARAIAFIDPDTLERYPALSRWFNQMKSLGK